MTNLQSKILSVLNTAIAERREIGLQLAVCRDGDLILDLAAGTTDGATPVTSTTLFPVYSCTKGIVTTLMHRLVDRKLISYETPVVSVWPEFAAHGKSGITLRHLLCHASGLYQLPPNTTNELLAHMPAFHRALADLIPLHSPGEHMIYHPVTFGNLLAEVAQRVTGKTFTQILHEEITGPLQLEDELFIGIPDAVERRVTPLKEIVPTPDPTKTVEPSKLDPGMPPTPLTEWMNRPDMRRACLPASNGIMTARAMAKHYAALIAPGVGGVRLFSNERRELATQLQLPAKVNPNGPWLKSLGYGLNQGNWPQGKVIPTFGHGGFGGSIAFACPAHHIAIALTKNLFSPRSAGGEILTTLANELHLTT